MEQREQQLIYLRKLADALKGHGFTTELLGKVSKPSLKVANAETPSLNERVLCKQNTEGLWVYEWPWQQPIGAVDDLVLVVSRIATVLRSVEQQADG
jgi:hypothetical protein